MKRIVSIFLVMALVCGGVFLFAANATSDTNYVVNDIFVEFYLNESGVIYGIDEENDDDWDYVESAKGSTVMYGFENGLVVNREKAYVNGYTTIDEDEVYFFMSTIKLVKAELLEDGVKTLPDEWQDKIEKYANMWARPLIKATLVHDNDEYVTHVVEKYDSKKHVLLARLWYSKNAHADVYTYLVKGEDGDPDYQVFCFCWAPAPVEPDITPTPTAKPTDKPTPTPTPSTKPTATPTVTPDPTQQTRPTATPVVTPDPTKPADNDDGGYDDNPLEDLDVKPAATPVVTADPETPADNMDGGYDENGLNNLHVDPPSDGNGGYGENPLNGNNNGGAEADLGTHDPATPVVSPDGETPIGGSSSSGATPSSTADDETPIGGSSPSSATPTGTADGETPIGGGNNSSSGSSSDTGNPLDDNNGGYGGNPLGN